MKSIQDIFSGEFAFANTAVVQKLRHDQHNDKAMKLNYTEHWPMLSETCEVLVLAFEISSNVRELFAGLITDIQPNGSDGLFRFYVDRFQRIGEHDRSLVSDANFYDTKGGGGSRVIIKKRHSNYVVNSDIPNLQGGMEPRLTWVRKHHKQFRDKVWRHWEGRCAVSNSECNGLLVASHIYPWARSTPKEQTDVENGLLLSVPLDKLFDRGLIGFENDGEMLVKEYLTKGTREIFGLPKSGTMIRKELSPEMAEYLTRHRKFFNF